jgi:starch synthase
MPLRICFISAEIAPLAKTGGLADVSGALTRYLDGAGHDVRAFMPLYSTIDRSAFAITPVASLQDVPLAIGPHSYRFSVFTAQLPRTKASVHLVDCPVLYGRPRLYTNDPDEHLRFLALTLAAFESCQRMAFAPEILHCHDWHAAFGPLFLRTLYSWDRLFASTRSVLTIHNIGYQGVFGAAAAADLALGASGYLLHQDDLRSGHINSLKHGIMYADLVTTVSPTYAREIRTPEYGMGLEHALRARGAAVVGILNGVDYQEWDPRTDRYLPRHYHSERLEGKAELKRALIVRLGLNVGPQTALAGVVTRLAWQKGVDLLVRALPGLLASRDVACVVLGSGDDSYERTLGELERAFPQRLVFHRGYSEELAHWIEAGSDLFLMPSHYEPCGLNQMYSLRYGTVPVVRETGGLADSVQRYDPASGQGTGILFRDFSAEALTAAVHAALDLYARPRHWRRMMRNGMAQNFSWEHQGAEYEALYSSLTGTVT